MRHVIVARIAIAGTAAVFAPHSAAAQQADRSSHAPPTTAGKIPITTSSAEARALFLRARALNETLKPHEAHVVFEQAVARDPSFAIGEYYLASTSPNARELNAHLTKAVTLAANASPGERLMILGMQARTNVDRTRARQLAESLVVLYPNDERARFVLGSIYAAQQRYPEEIAQFEKAIAINPTYSLAYNQIGYAYRAVGDMNSAESAFQKNIALLPDDPNPHDSYAELLMKMGRFDASIAEYKKALAIDPHFGASHIGIAANEIYLRRHGDAVKELDIYYKAARDDGERRAALANQAMVHVDHGGTDAAVAAMEKSRDIASAARDIAGVAADESVIGDILLDAGQLDDAVARYAHAHDVVARSALAPELKDDDALAAHYDQARIALAHHQLAAARTEATTYTSGATTKKNDARIRQAHELNGLVALEAKDFDVSLTELAKADQENPAVWYAMSRAEGGKGNASKAAEYATRARSMNILPTFPYAFTRAAIGSATGAVSSRSVRGTRR
ncbi:MAG TPA: tetratricopeptide repeat protein [Gemmatimonadaceae bacterium]|jgi:superkiller protein 3